MAWQLRDKTGLLTDDLEHLLSDDFPSVLAATRSSGFPMERPVGRKLHEFKSQLLKLHKAAGHSSLRPPGLWELLDMDVFEYEFLDNLTNQRQKAKYLIMVDRASRLCSATHYSSGRAIQEKAEQRRLRQQANDTWLFWRRTD